MADTAVAISAGTGTNIDTRTEGTNGNHRQVVTLGDPATNAGVAPVDATAGLKVDLGADNDVTNGGTFAVQVTSIAAGSNAIGKLAANSGVDIGDVDVTSFPRAAAAALSNVADTASSTTLKASNAARLGLIIVNDSTVTLYVKYGTTASATDYTYQLQAGETLREDTYTGRVDGIWASDAIGSARVTELTAS